MQKSCLVDKTPRSVIIVDTWKIFFSVSKMSLKNPTPREGGVAPRSIQKMGANAKRVSRLDQKMSNGFVYVKKHTHILRTVTSYAPIALRHCFFIFRATTMGMIRENHQQSDCSYSITYKNTLLNK